MSDDLKGMETLLEIFDKLRNDPRFIFKYGMEQGEILERERIIKLLETKYAELIDLYGIALAQKELDLLLELKDRIKGKAE